MEKVADDDYGMVGKTHYLLHRAVVQCDKETTKIHVVFDASAKIGNEPSHHILVRFRLDNIILIFFFFSIRGFFHGH